MENQNTQKYIGFIVIILIIVAGVFLFKSKKVDAPADTTGTEIKDTTIVDTPDTTGEDTVKEPNTKPDDTTENNLTTEQKALLAKLQKSVDDRDFESFAILLLEVYKNQWPGVPEFKALESELYVYATDTYWVKGDLENSLRVSTIVYDKVVEAWRFRYLRIISLEKYGRNALDAGDLVTAEDYAMQILQMMFRPEGANLMADIYISKVNTNIKEGNTELAKQNLGYIWAYEVDQARRDTLTKLKTDLNL